MGKIIAIGGGEIGRPGYSVETIEIDKEIIRLTGKKHPKLLFIPTATADDEIYVKTVEKHFGKRLRCGVDNLFLVKEKSPIRQIEEKILGADIIYVVGGNTLKMLNIWKKKGVDKMIQKAYSKGIVLSGLSAGAICWFKYGNSDSKLKETGKLMKIKCLNYIGALACPHYNGEKIKETCFEINDEKNHGCGIGI